MRGISVNEIENEREAAYYADMLLSELQRLGEREFILATENYEYLSDFKQSIATDKFNLVKMQNGCPMCHFFETSEACLLATGGDEDVCDGACYKKLSYQYIVDGFNNKDYLLFLVGVSKFRKEVKEKCNGGNING